MDDVTSIDEIAKALAANWPMLSVIRHIRDNVTYVDRLAGV